MNVLRAASDSFCEFLVHMHLSAWVFLVHFFILFSVFICCTGLIGKITLHIPLRRLRSEPWVISIEKLYLVAGPLSNLQVIVEGYRREHAFFMYIDMCMSSMQWLGYYCSSVDLGFLD